MTLDCTTKCFDSILKNSAKRIQVIQGGSGAGKTYSILQFLYIVAYQSTVPLIITVVAETYHFLANGVIRDFIRILGDNYNESMHNKSTNSFTIGKSIVEFMSVDQPHKARGARRDILFINECNAVPKETYTQLEIRTRKKVFLDFNPVQDFYAISEVAHQDNASYEIFTYKDNPFLEPEIVQSIESRRNQANWFRIFGEGQVGFIEGRIMPDFTQIENMPNIPTTCGMDFGFNDPSVLLESGIQGDSLYVNQLFYETGMTNQKIARRMKQLHVPLDYLIFADCAEPKSIFEIRQEGFKGIKGCLKGADSFVHGVHFLSRYKIFVTKSSMQTIRDFRNAQWEGANDGETFLNTAKPGYLHSIDALRYSLSNVIRPSTGFTAHIGKN